MYDAINRGLQRATGEICGYLNCDEQYLPGTLAKVTQFFEKHPEVDVLFGDVILIDREGQPLSYRRTVLPTKHHIRLAHLNTPTCATFFRRKLLDQGFHFDPQWKAIGDAAWVENLLKAKIRMATFPAPLAVFTFTGENLGATSVSKSEASRWKGKTWGSRRLKQIIAVLIHRVRKFLAGAYRKRHVDVSIYTLGSPNTRQRFVRRSLGFRWPV